MSTRPEQTEPGLIGRHKLAATVLALSCVASCSAAESTSSIPGHHRSRYVAYLSPQDSQGQWRFPNLALDPLAWFRTTKYGKPTVAAVAKTNAKMFGADTPPVRHLPRTSNKFAVAAAHELKADGKSIHCPKPVNTQYIVPFIGEKIDTNAKVCLQTNQLRVAKTSKGVDVVIMPMAVSLGYADRNQVSLDNAFAGYTPAQCKERTDRLEAFGQALLANTHQIPRGQAAEIGIVVDPALHSACDTWPPAAQ